MKNSCWKTVLKPSKLLLCSILIMLPLYPVYAGDECRQGKHCSAPGECGGYLDDNHNNLCDRGESKPTPTPVPASVPINVLVTPQNIIPATVDDSDRKTKECPQHCAFPGKCGRYLDVNHNQLCDYGETIQVGGSTSTPSLVTPQAMATPAVATTPTVSKSHSQVWNTCRHQKHCSYPGECGGYVDTDGNNLCDRGELAPTPTTTPVVSETTAEKAQQKKMLHP